jgi:hypothetical protein
MAQRYENLDLGSLRCYKALEPYLVRLLMVIEAQPQLLYQKIIVRYYYSIKKSSPPRRRLERLQTQEFESIKKLTALTFFAGAYMYCNKQEILDNPVLKKQISRISLLGCGKGIIGLKYLKQGLESMITTLLVVKWQKEYDVSNEELEEMIEYWELEVGLKSVKS